MAHILERKSMIVSGSKKRLADCRPLSRVKNFATQEEGAMIGFSLFLFLAMFIFAGVAIDLMRHEYQRTRIQATMDRALLAAANPDQERDRKSVVLDYFSSAGLDGIVEREDVTVSVASDGTSVKATSRSTMNTPFMDWVGVSSLPVPAGGGAEKSIVLTEVSLVVDVSGSMESNSVNGVRKIDELKTAATEFSNLILCDPNNSASPTDWSTCPIQDNKTSLTLVPYSAQVSVGANLLSKFTVADTHSESTCVTFDPDEFDVAGISTTDTLHQTAQYVRGGERAQSNRYIFDTSNWEEPDIQSNAQWYETWWSCFNASWRDIVPFENSPQQMASEISQLSALGGTAIHVGMKWGTALLHQDAQPAITSLIDDDGLVHSDFRGRPYNFANTLSSKIIVLMTDGVNSTSSFLKDGFRTGASPIWYNSEEDILSVRDNRGTPDNDSDDRWYWFNPAETKNNSRNLPYGEWKNEPFGNEGKNHCFDDDDRSWNSDVCVPYRGAANSRTKQLTWQEYWKKGYSTRIFDSFGDYIGNEVDTPGTSTGFRSLTNTAVDDLLIEQCTAAKDMGITIYTISMVADDDDSSTIMNSCASDIPGTTTHHRVGDTDADGDIIQLSTVFAGIAEDINRLRLTN